jgi:hypothetical protein
MTRFADSPSRRLCTGALALAFAATGLAACATGKRPTLGPVVDKGKTLSRQGTGDALIDKVLLPLESLDASTFTATYVVTPKGGQDALPVPFEVVVAQTQPLARSVAMGDALFMRSTDSITCTVSAKACLPGVDNSKATKPLTGTFFDDDVKAMIRAAFAGKTKAAFNRSENIVDQEAVCVTIPTVTDEDFCVLPSGHLAKVETAQVTIVLKAFSNEADPNLFTRPDAAPAEPAAPAEDPPPA